MGRHRGTRPRYRRISVAVTAAFVTGIAVLGGTGLLPTGSTPESAAADAGSAPASTSHQPVTTDPSTPADDPTAGGATSTPAAPSSAPSSAPPADSGLGKRVVFDISDQRVWLVSGKDKLLRSYLVSGSLTDNLQPGTYTVYSKSRRAIGVDDSGVMQYMVRFARGPNAAIGFHDIPSKDGRFVQTREQLGTPQSHGCIRQWRPDAKALWSFAPVDTEVVVLD